MDNSGKNRKIRLSHIALNKWLLENPHFTIGELEVFIEKKGLFFGENVDATSLLATLCADGIIKQESYFVVVK